MTAESAESALTLDRIAGDWKIYQLRRGHRFSTDDMVTAWRAAHHKPEASRVLDLGCGIGSVALLTLYRLGHPRPELVGIEAQELSVDLARKSVAYNGLSETMRVVHGDLRDEACLASAEPFDLITGSPPYFPVGTGVISSHPQKAGARMELRGSVFDYCEAARRWLASGGRFCFVMLAQDDRTERAPKEHGLVVIERVNVTFREGRAPHLAVMVCARKEESAPGVRAVKHLCVRDQDGVETAQYRSMRAEMGGFLDVLGGSCKD